MICLLEGEEVGRFEIRALEDVRRYGFGTAFHSAARSYYYRRGHFVHIFLSHHSVAVYNEEQD